MQMAEEGPHCMNNVEYDFFTCPNTLSVKIGTHLSREDVLAHEDDGLELQQMMALFACH